MLARSASRTENDSLKHERDELTPATVINRCDVYCAHMSADAIRDTATLRTMFREPSGRAITKEIDHIDDLAAGFIAAAPLFVLATAAHDRVDASPRGGDPGFVKVISPTRLAFGDLAGNNRIDSYRNLVDTPAVAMLFMVPGSIETLRVNGQAAVTTDAHIRELCTIDDRIPNIAITVDVDTCFMHCGKALRRSATWEPDTWPAAGSYPSGAELLHGHTNSTTPVCDIAEGLNAGYQATMWEPGGVDTSPS